MTTYFKEIYDRIREITNAPTQVELAKVLGIRQSSISDAKRRGSIPSEWYLTLFEKFGLNPDWLKKGIGPTYLRTEMGYAPSDDSLTVQLAEEGSAYGGSPVAHGVSVPVYKCEIDAYDDTLAPVLKAGSMINLPQHFARTEFKVFVSNSTAMEPVIRRNAYVGVDCTSKHPISGEVFAIVSAHEGVILRRLYVDEDKNRILLRADAAGHLEATLSIEAAPQKIIGRVAWVLQEF